MLHKFVKFYAYMILIFKLLSVDSFEGKNNNGCLFINKKFVDQDAEGLKETGRFYGVSPICVEAVAHDMMLDCLWDKGAKVILSWLKDLKK